MATDRITKHNKSHITTPYSVRFTNEEMDAIERIMELGGYANKGEVIKAMLKPTLSASVTALNTGSVLKASSVLFKEQKAFGEKLVTYARATDPTEEFEFDAQFA
jgi:Arc/MetJ-type ribon-helix-helix transcriptional regulator